MFKKLSQLIANLFGKPQEPVRKPRLVPPPTAPHGEFHRTTSRTPKPTLRAVQRQSKPAAAPAASTTYTDYTPPAMPSFDPSPSDAGYSGGGGSFDGGGSSGDW